MTKLNNVFSMVAKGVFNKGKSIVSGLPIDFSNPTITGGEINTNNYGLGYPYGLVFSPDGLVLHVTGIASLMVIRFELTVPWDVNSTVTTTVIPMGYQCLSLRWVDNGNRVFTCDYSIAAIREYECTTPYNFDTRLATGKILNVKPDASAPYDFTFTKDGKKLIVPDRGGKFNQYVLSTPYDLTTAVKEYDTSRFGGTTYALFLYNNDEKLLIVNATGGLITQYSFNGGLQNTVSDEETFATNISNLTGIYINPEGTLLFLISYTTKKVQSFSLV